MKFTGLDNFKYALFQDPTYNQILATSIRDIVIDVPLIIFFSLFIAMICNGKFKGRTLVRAILFLPIIMNAGAINNAIEMAREAVTGGVAAVSAEAAVASGVNVDLSLIHISEPTRRTPISYAVFFLKKKKAVFCLKKKNHIKNY